MCWKAGSLGRSGPAPDGDAKRTDGLQAQAVGADLGYFKNHQSRMRCDVYLSEGYPIATGVIGGACRHVVKDRLERAGMRWVMDGAQAMLDLRTIHLSDQWDEFQKYRIKRVAKRLYQNAEWPVVGIAASQGRARPVAPLLK